MKYVRLKVMNASTDASFPFKKAVFFLQELFACHCMADLVVDILIKEEAALLRQPL